MHGRKPNSDLTVPFAFSFFSVSFEFRISDFEFPV